MLDSLVARMPNRIMKARKNAIAEARAYIQRVAASGGTPPTSRTFLEPGSKDERIDIEVISGFAFVP